MAAPSLNGPNQGSLVHLRALTDWLAFRDYDVAKAEAVRKIMGRYSRGNVAVQAGRYVSDADFTPMVEGGDRAIVELERAAHSG